MKKTIKDKMLYDTEFISKVSMGVSITSLAVSIIALILKLVV